jgi:CRISPR type III-B/RAMP module-associated protein Cmr5
MTKKKRERPELAEPETPFSSALSDIDRVRKSIKEEGGSHFRSFARSFPAMLQSEGLVISLSFMYSKIRSESKGNGEMLLAVSPGKEIADQRSAIACYFKLVVDYLNSRFPFQSTAPLNVIGELASNYEKLRISEALLTPYVMQLKTLSEAVFEESKGIGR